MACAHDIIIRPAVIGDAWDFPAIENSAGMRFEESAELAFVAQGEDRSVGQYRGFIERGLSWAADTRAGRCIGFICATPEDGELHVWELAVCRDHQGSGIGRALLATAVREAERRGMAALTLTTFSNVAWNAPFYARLGFEVIEGSALSGRLQALLDEEGRNGLPREYRCAMRLGLAEARPCHGSELLGAGEGN